MRLRNYILAAIFTALTAVCSQMIIPMPLSPVPFSLSIVAVFLTGALLEPKFALASQLVFIALGAAGLPVFSGFAGGLAKLLGPTGGYIIAYPIMALIVALISSKLKKSFVSYLLGMFLSLIVCYAFGTAWLAFSLKVSIAKALSLGVLPYAIFDALKVIISASFSFSVNAALEKAYGKQRETE